MLYICIALTIIIEISIWFSICAMMKGLVLFSILVVGASAEVLSNRPQNKFIGKDDKNYRLQKIMTQISLNLLFNIKAIN